MIDWLIDTGSGLALSILAAICIAKQSERQAKKNTKQLEEQIKAASFQVRDIYKLYEQVVIELTKNSKNVTYNNFYFGKNQEDNKQHE